MPPPVPVAVFFSSFEPSAASDAVLKVLPHLDRDRFDVRLACIDRRGPWLERAESAGGQAISFPVKGFHHPSAVTEARRFTRWLTAHGIAVVHADHRDELRRSAVEQNPQVGVGLQRQRVRVDGTAQAVDERRRRSRGAALAATAANGRSAEIEAINPDAVRRRVGALQRLRILAGT